MGTTLVAYLLFPFLVFDGIRPMQATLSASAASAVLKLNDVAACFPFLVLGGVRRMQATPPASATSAVLKLKGVAAWYGGKFQGRMTANGETFDLHAYTAAHRTLPFGTLVRVRHACNGRHVIVRINDRGPYGGGRIIDLSQAAAREIGIYRKGRCKVELQVVDGDAQPGPPAVKSK